MQRAIFNLDSYVQSLSTFTLIWLDLVITKRDVVIHHYVPHQMIYLVNRGIVGHVSLL